jgi:hypothetical protein
MAETLNNYFLVAEGGEPSELAFTPSAEVLGRYPIDLSTGLATLQPPQDQGPVINDLERIAYAAPTPPRLDFSAPPALGTYQPPQPVTPAAAPPRASYAAPTPVRIDMTPMLNAGLATLPQPQAPAPTPSLANPMSFAAPAAVRVEPTPAPAPTPSTVSQPKSKPSTSQPPSTGEVYARIGDPLPGQPGVRVGDPIPPDSGGNEWVWDLTNPELGYWVPPKPTPPEPPKVDYLTPEQVTETVGTQTPTTSTPTVTPGTNTPPPGTEIKEEVSEYVPARVIIDPIKYPPVPEINFQFTEPAPATPINRQPGRLIPALKPVDIELPMRRAVERLAPGLFRDINYDPELILEAAMRSLGPRYAKQSLLDEQRMFERMK